MLIDKAVKHIDRKVKAQFVFNRFKGYILSLRGDEDKFKRAMSKLVYGDYIRREFNFMLDFVISYTDIDDLIAAMTPNCRNL